MEVIKSNKGSSKLCYEGRTYTKKNSSKSTIRWECSKRGSVKCTGAVVTNLDTTDVKSSKPHSHEADQFEVEIQKVRAEIKASAQSCRGKPSQIIADKMINYPVSIRSLVGDAESIKRTVRRIKHAQVPAEPNTIQDIPYPVPEPYNTTRGLEQSDFLIYDNGSANDGMMIFGSETGLELLGESETWYMDGTYDTAPKQFSQLFVLRVALGDSYVSSVYGFLPSKSQSCHEEFISAILDICLRKNIRPSPVRVVADLEVGIHNAVRTILGTDIDIQRCFYHLTQTTWRKIQTEGLQAIYLAEKEIQHYCGKLDGLAFLPIEDVVAGMTLLREDTPECMSGVVDYFDSTYVSGGFRSVRGANGTLRFRRTPPLTWNVHGTTIMDRQRTNNVCEAWNNRFKQMMGHSNPSMWTVISCLQKENMDVETETERIRRGEPSVKRRNKKSVKLQKRLKTLCTHYSAGHKTLSEFLAAIGSCIRLH